MSTLSSDYQQGWDDGYEDAIKDGRSLKLGATLRGLLAADVKMMLRTRSLLLATGREVVDLEDAIDAVDVVLGKDVVK